MKLVLLLACVSLLALPESGAARDSDFGLGFGVSTPYYFTPTSEVGDTSIHLTAAWTPRRWLSLIEEPQFAVNGFHEVAFHTGARFYAFNGYTLRPFLDIGGLLQLHPRTDGGIRTGLGFSYDRFLGVDRLRLSLQWNLNRLFRDPSSLSFDLYRVAVSAYY